MIVAARRVDPIVRENHRRLKDTIESVLTPAGEKLGKARFLVYGKDAYPDATFTLRLSYGTVKLSLQRTIAPPFTTFYGLYDRRPLTISRPSISRPKNRRPRQGGPHHSLDFVSTNDIIGGNSGSPSSIATANWSPGLRRQHRIHGR